MRDKHLHVPKDSELLKSIYRSVETDLDIGNMRFRAIIWTKLVFYLSASVLLYTMLYKVETPVAFVLTYIGYGFAVLLLAFNFAHDFSHGTVFKNKNLNQLGFVLTYTLVGAHAEAWKLRHIHSHHYAPNVEGYDSDLEISSWIRVIPNSPHYWFHRYQHWYAPLAYTTYSLFWVFIKDFVLLFSKSQYGEHKNFGYHLSFGAQKLAYLTYILVFPMLYSGQWWFTVLLGFLLMHLMQSLFLLFTFFMTHHVEATAYPTTNENGRINTSWVMNQIESSNDMHPFSEPANFILGGFNNHIAHHLFPHYHHIHYPRINRILYKVLAQHHITPNQTTYWGGVLSHLRLLKRMSRP